MDRKIREWTLHEEIGRGGMGVVYRATHEMLPGDWAVKIIHPELGRDAESRTRFLSEVRILKRLHHPNIIEVETPFVEAGEIHLPMEYLTGGSLDSALKATPGPWALARAVDIVRQAAEGVGHAHSQDPAVLHRDIKPGNIHLLDNGRVKVLDFGLARTLGEKSMTATGKAVGTPAYMAPEILDGRKSTARSDVYGLGVVLYRLLAGRLPYDMPEEDSSLLALVMAVGRAHERGLPDVREFAPSVPADLAGLVMRTLSRDPAGRPADGAELASLLGRVDLGSGTGSGTEESYGRMKIRPSGTGTGSGTGSGTGTGTGTGTGATVPDADSTYLGIDLDAAQRAPVQAGRDSTRSPASTASGSDDLDRSLLGLEVPRPMAPPQPPRISPAPAPSPVSGNKRKSRNILVLSLVVGILVVALAGWYFGYELPSRSGEIVGAEGGKLEAAVSTEAASSPVPAASPDSEIPSGWALIPAGSFVMGSTSGEAGRLDSEGPQTRVTISQAFLLKATEVTQGEWKAVMGTTPSYFSSCGDDCPVEQVSWNDAVEYCNRLSKKENLEQCYDKSGDLYTFRGVSCRGYRLPTEAEWEYAARAGATAARYGDLDVVAWYDQNSGDKTQPVGQKQPNAWGLYDMLGNVWEWCGDWYAGNLAGGSVTDPTGPLSGSGRVIRGGSWYASARYVRAACRGINAPGYRDNGLGLRPARSLR